MIKLLISCIYIVPYKNKKAVYQRYTAFRVD